MDNTEDRQDFIEAFWQRYLEQSGKSGDTRFRSVFHFELTEKWANELLRLVLIGQKKATASSLWSYALEGEDLPQVGDLHIITDWAGTPRCVIETVDVTLLPFSEITFDICQREGEDDTLESWQEGHRRFFQAEGKAMGYVFQEDMPVVFEDFEVVFPGDDVVQGHHGSHDQGNDGGPEAGLGPGAP